MQALFCILLIAIDVKCLATVRALHFLACIYCTPFLFIERYEKPNLLFYGTQKNPKR